MAKLSDKELLQELKLAIIYLEAHVRDNHTFVELYYDAIKRYKTKIQELERKLNE